jgi:hypothetical protein
VSKLSAKVVEVVDLKRPELEMFVGFCGPRKTEESHRVLSEEGVKAHSQIIS